jgi:predicted TIM-barrel fold metal-dependent hydrolase
LDRPPFVDAHVHFWQLSRLRYPWLTPPFDDGGPNGPVAAIAQDYTFADYLVEAGGWDVRGMVHVDAGADPRDALAETEWLQATADAHGMPNAIIAYADLAQSDVDDLLAAHVAHANVRGIRHIVNWHRDADRTYTARDVTSDAAWQNGFARLAAHGLSFDLQCYPGQMPGLARLLQQHPDIPVCINHAGMGVDGEADWRDGMQPLAALPQVAVKLSGFGFVFRPLDPSKVRDRLRRTIDLFGPERCMIASDFPTDRLFGGFDAILDSYLEAVHDLPDAQIRALFAGNANRFYRLGLDLTS